MSTILVIDDDAAILQMLRRALEHDRHTVQEAQDGSAGMQLYREQAFDLVITDLYMPEQDGIETIQQLRDMDPACRILAISGDVARGSGSALRDARMLGADAVLAKPFTVTALLHIVRDLLAR